MLNVILANAGAFGAVAGLASLAASGKKEVMASDALPIPDFPFEHKKLTKALDHASVRRGFQVYKEVCASCHSLDRIAYRNLVDVIGTEDEIKKWAEDVDFPTEPNAEGEVGERKGKLTDYLPRPYINELAARAANNGALPPDLSLIKKARVGGEDYLFALLTGYRDAPAGVTLREGQYYNPYFAGGAIGMEQALKEGSITYDDGTEATASQMAKDVSVFLTWTAEPEHDERKKLGVKTIILFTLMAIPTLYYKRVKWSVLKTRQIRFGKF